MQKIIDWFTKTANDLKKFDERMQTEVQKYANKQCRKALVAGAVAGVLIGFAAGKLA